MPGGWFPLQFGTTGNFQRYAELIAWARETLYPLFALPLGLEYSTTIGSLELEDYAAFFHPRPMPVPAGIAQNLGVPARLPVAYFPRRSFDLWGARYFLLPASPDWSSLERGFASFLDKTELVYPDPDLLFKSQSREGREPWNLRHDWQLRRNLAAYPRLARPLRPSPLPGLRPGHPPPTDQDTHLHERSALERARPSCPRPAPDGTDRDER